MWECLWERITLHQEQVLEERPGEMKVDMDGRECSYIAFVCLFLFRERLLLQNRNKSMEKAILDCTQDLYCVS